MGIFDWRQAENKIVNKTDRALKKDKQADKPYLPNQNIGKSEKMGIIEDEYTKAQRLEELKSDQDSQGNFFTDKNGNKFKISELNGQTEKLLREARASILKEENANKTGMAVSAGEEDETPEAIKIMAKHKNINHEPTSIEKFHNAHGYTGEPGSIDRERIGVKPGLYKDYNPKLNAGAPGNIKERRRQSRKANEKNNWTPTDSEDIWSDLPDLPND